MTASSTASVTLGVMLMSVQYVLELGSAASTPDGPDGRVPWRLLILSILELRI
jgi:hypothetical protein